MRSRIPGFYRLSPAARLEALIEHGALDAEQAALLVGEGLTLPQASCMVENAVGLYALPNAVAVNLLINGEDRVVPMVVEEPSVLAAVSNMAQVTRKSGGIAASSDASVMIGQVQVYGMDDPAGAFARLEEHTDALLEVARKVHPRLAARGGGVRGIRVRRIVYDEEGFDAEEMVVVELLLDCLDAMGANMVNTAAEHLAPHVEAIAGGKVGLRILSNLASHRLARARIRMAPAHLAATEQEGREIAEGIARAWRFAWADPWRATTHNKGVMNGIDAVAVATGNDWRAIEAGAHAWCAREGTYRPMTTWRLGTDGFLVGQLEVPLQMGTVGGASRVHPTARANLAMLGGRGARDLASVAAAVGLVQNLGALRALATEGIQSGHMRMHARTVASAAGATPAEIPLVVEALCSANDFSTQRAADVLAELRA